MGLFTEAVSDIQHAVARHAQQDTANIQDVAPPVQEQGSFAAMAQQLIEVMPTGQEVGQELGNRVEETKGFFAEMAADIKAELTQLGAQGASELANGLFNGHAYHPGNAMASSQPEQAQELERGGRE